ncbi:unnamed protein product [Rhizophagus irregularis]|nr:unnamed protein product [Rhizophagus irregularis]
MEKESSGEKSLAKLITGDHVIEKFQGLVRSYRLLDLYAKGKPKWRVMKNEAKYFQEFSLHFWKKPGKFVVLVNIHDIHDQNLKIHYSFLFIYFFYT